MALLQPGWEPDYLGRPGHLRGRMRGAHRAVRAPGERPLQHPAARALPLPRRRGAGRRALSPGHHRAPRRRAGRPGEPGELRRQLLAALARAGRRPGVPRAAGRAAARAVRERPVPVAQAHAGRAAVAARLRHAWSRAPRGSSRSSTSSSSSRPTAKGARSTRRLFGPQGPRAACVRNELRRGSRDRRCRWFPTLRPRRRPPRRGTGRRRRLEGGCAGRASSGHRCPPGRSP